MDKDSLARKAGITGRRHADSTFWISFLILLISAPGWVTAHAAHPKVSAKLNSAVDKLLTNNFTGSAISNAGSARVDGDRRIQAYVYFAGGEDVFRLLESRGATVEIINHELQIAQAWLSAGAIDEIAALDSITRITLPVYARRGAGAVTTEGDAIINADDVRARGIDGGGVKVGVISDGVNNWTDARATGDLPAAITVVQPCRNPAADEPGWCNEGTAMLEIVHDVAPGAQLGFCGAYTNLEFIQCIDELTGNFGAHIVVDDIAFFGEPYFQDGPVAQTVTGALARGIAYVSVAHNFASQHYETDFRAMADPNAPGPAHDFGAAAGLASDSTLDVEIAPGATGQVILQWGDPFESSGNNYDLYILNEAGEILDSSREIQDGDDRPLEVVEVTNSSNAPVSVKVGVVNLSGIVRRIEMFFFAAFPREYNVPEGSIIGHAAVAGVLAVGAINALDPGVDEIERFSSRGPSLILFPAQETRPKPDVAAIDNVSITGAGGFSSPFRGTSAAAPHAAGVAALLKQANPGLTVGELNAAIMNSAVDLGAPGSDNIYGAGRVDALGAVQAVSAPAPAPANPGNPEPNDSGGGAMLPLMMLFALLGRLLVLPRTLVR